MPLVDRGKALLKPQDGGLQWFEVVVDSTADVTVVRVEVPMGEAVAHPCDVAPGVTRFGVEQLGGDSLDRLSNLYEADPDGVEDQPVRQITPCR